jgi:sulfide:quinone oxidoreductase
MASAPLRVVVVGGGFAAAELLLAARALAEERVELELIAPETRLAFRMASTGAPFGAAAVRTFDLAELAADVGATVRRGRVEAVAAKAHRLRLASGPPVDYDVLVVAVGARATAAVPGAVTFRDQRDGDRVRRVVDELVSGEIRRVAYAAPTGVAWTLPLYELALLTAAEVARAGRGEVALVTPERRALEVFGATVSDAVEQLLTDHEISLVRRAPARHANRDGLALAAGGLLRADRVVAIPRLAGRAISGLPSDWSGFLPTDAWGRVLERPDVFAAGDVTSFPIKQGGIATQQADLVAHQVAARAGARVDALPSAERVLRTRLLGADGPLYLRATVDGEGRPLPARDGAPEVSRDPEWWPPAKLFGRYLTPWMAAAEARARRSAGARVPVRGAPRPHRLRLRTRSSPS